LRPFAAFLCGLCGQDFDFSCGKINPLTAKFAKDIRKGRKEKQGIPEFSDHPMETFRSGL
jgi:hypothetical protein